MPDGAESTMALATDFPAHSREDWQRLVAAVLNKTRAADAHLDGAQAEASMRSTLAGDVTIDPLYLQPSSPAPVGVPGAMPFTRGRVLRDSAAAWDVRQWHDDPDLDASRAAVLADLEHGVTSVWVQVGADGIPAAGLATVLADVHFDLAPVAVTSWDDQAGASAALLALLDAHGDTAAGGNLGLDPLGAAQRMGGTPDFTELAPAVQACLGRGQLRAITVDTRPMHEAGANAVDELGFALATGLTYLRHLEAHGVAPTDAFDQIEFRIAVTQDQFLSSALPRALRRTWARLGEALGVPESLRGARIHAVTSGRMFSRDDPFVNVLRSTLAAFGASVGGADAITVLPYDTVAGLPTAFSRRLARNTQLLLADESNVGRVADPGGGAWYLEHLTDDLAQGAWRVLQESERAGGIAAMFADGSLADRLAASAAARRVGLDHRAIALTGVSMFPQLQEPPTTRCARELLPAAGDALPVIRDAAAFEDLRDRAQRLGSPALLLRTLGAQRDFGARQTFVQNLLAAGGVGTTDAVTETAVIASSPKGYAEFARAAVAELREAGVTRVLIAGRMGELGDDAGLVDGEIRDGMDVVAFLSDLLTDLGAPAAGGQA